MSIDPERVKTLFLNAAEMVDPMDRAAYLERECMGDAELRERVEALLRADGGAVAKAAVGDTVEPEPIYGGTTIPETPGALEGSAEAESTEEYQPHVAPGLLIANRYTLEQRIGEGGMGEVWVAKQTEPVKRKVALKLIKAGMDSRGVLQRFEQERQALAMMDHPHIAKVLDGGMTATGQPFFVMELVNGMPLTKFCDEMKLTPRERLELFVPICQAVQHAHQKGVVHRDLKPGNILVSLVDGRPVPMVIDFGVAKATGGKLTDETLSTQFGAMVGTLEYMSPEQAGYSGEDIDTRADIYSLGVILYELLTGLRPIDSARLRRAAWDEVIRIIREEEPSKPSTRLSTEMSLPSMAAMRGIEPRKLMAMLRGELDWVVMKCLEKRRERRYETANALAREIQRYLADEAVEARPPSLGYRFQKFVLRNPLQLAVAGMVGLLVVGGLSVAWWQTDQAGRRREADLRRQIIDEKRAAAERARLTRNFEAVSGLLDRAEEALRANDATRAEVAIEAALKRAGEGGAEKAVERLKRLEADLSVVRELDAVDKLRWTPDGIGRWDPKELANQVREALTRFGAYPGEVSVDAAAGRIDASVVRDRIVPALDLLLIWEKANGVRQLLGRVDGDPYRDLVRDAIVGDAPEKLREILNKKEALEQPPEFAAILGDTSFLVSDVERQQLILETATSREPGNIGLLMAMAYAHQFRKNALGEDSAAERIRWYQAALAAAPGNPEAHVGLGEALADEGLIDDAIEVFRRGIELDPTSNVAYWTLGMSLKHNGRIEDAIVAFRKSIELAPTTSSIVNYELGRTLREKGRFDEAIAEFKKAVQLFPGFEFAHRDLGLTLMEKGQADEAIDAFKKAIELQPRDWSYHYGLGLAMYQIGRTTDAIEAMKKAVELDAPLGEAHYNLGVALRQMGRDDEARSAIKKAIEVNTSDARSYHDMGSKLMREGQVDEAIDAFTTAIEAYTSAPLLRSTLPRTRIILSLEMDKMNESALVSDVLPQLHEVHRKVAAVHSDLGVALLSKGLVDEAIVTIKKAIGLDQELATAHCNLGLAMMYKGQIDEAIKAFMKAINLDPKLFEAHHNLGRGLQVKGRLEDAVDAFKRAIGVDPNASESYYYLGLVMYQMGRIDDSIVAYNKAIELNHEHAAAHNDLGLAMMQKGDVAAAIVAFKKAIELDPNIPQSYANLGLALFTQGQYAEAKVSLAKAHSLLPQEDPTRALVAQYVQQSEYMLILEKRFPRLLRGEEQATSSRELLYLAMMCRAKRLYAASARFSAQAFSAEPALASSLQEGFRYAAAYSAALAAAGQGDDAGALEDQERTQLRRQALDWLRADLVLLDQVIQKGDTASRDEAKLRLQHWRQDPDLASVRDAEALKKLPHTEQGEWERFWVEVGRLMQVMTGSR